MKNSSVPGNLDRAQNAGRLEAFWVRCGQWKSGIFPLVTEQYMDEVVLHGLGKELVKECHFISFPVAEKVIYMQSLSRVLLDLDLI